ncbi:hypothetical protein D3C86_846720 [compost metagenome]
MTKEHLTNIFLHILLRVRSISTKVILANLRFRIFNEGMGKNEFRFRIGFLTPSYYTVKI